ncbi:acylhydrolase [Muricauda sp. JGD-17]|uniref:Acylhydrolase n=1 Tax=Flagellimonas ochracea TaxID=2696472 RepID=A0A964TA48_9FLAO|nr:SGNH/GDSL hydrolase family protein [Allomuricauda ochracea]NAY91052.1 acylhydrolase [Allomuricauda ochracea]
MRFFLVSIMLLSFLSGKKVLSQDWPNLAKYQKANEAVEAPLPDENRVVFMGNSITEGWLDANPGFFNSNPYINRGIGGQTTPQMLLRFRQDVIELKPKIVVILAGTNDIAGNTGTMTLEQIRDNILSMVELAVVNGIYPIVCSVLPAYDYPWRQGLRPNIKIPRLNKMLEDMTEKKGVVYLDYYTAMADNRNGLPAEYTTDEVHLTPAGYSVMESLAQKAIKQVLKNED